jgi:hypothetical protein
MTCYAFVNYLLSRVCFNCSSLSILGDVFEYYIPLLLLISHILQNNIKFTQGVSFVKNIINLEFLKSFLSQNLTR